MISRRNRIIIIVASVVIAALATVFLLFFSHATYLVLTDDLSGTHLRRVRMNGNKEFSIRFIHSVNISPVTEIFQIREGEIVLTALEFYTFGAGMPTEPQDGQTLIHLPEGGMRIDGFDRVMDGMRYSIGYDTEHTLRVGTRKIVLDTLESAGRRIRFDVEILNLRQRMRA